MQLNTINVRKRKSSANQTDALPSQNKRVRINNDEGIIISDRIELQSIVTAPINSSTTIYDEEQLRKIEEGLTSRSVDHLTIAAYTSLMKTIGNVILRNIDGFEPDPFVRQNKQSPLQVHPNSNGLYRFSMPDKK